MTLLQIGFDTLVPNLAENEMNGADVADMDSNEFADLVPAVPRFFQAKRCFRALVAHFNYHKPLAAVAGRGAAAASPRPPTAAASTRTVSGTCESAYFP